MPLPLDHVHESGLMACLAKQRQRCSCIGLRLLLWQLHNSSSPVQGQREQAEPLHLDGVQSFSFGCMLGQAEWAEPKVTGMLGSGVTPARLEACAKVATRVVPCTSAQAHTKSDVLCICLQTAACLLVSLKLPLNMSTVCVWTVGACCQVKQADQGLVCSRSTLYCNLLYPSLLLMLWTTALPAHLAGWLARHTAVETWRGSCRLGAGPPSQQH